MIEELLSSILLLVIVLTGFSYMIVGRPKNKKIMVKYRDKKIIQEEPNGTKKLLYIGVAVVVLMLFLSN